jgi:hypothetical protein
MKRAKVLKYAAIGAGSAIVVVFLYLLTTTLRVAGGVTKVAHTPTHLIRLQVVNGSGVRGLERKVAKQLSDYTDSILTVHVVDTAVFGVTELPRSAVISRRRDKAAAVLLAERLGIDPDDVIYEPLEHNTRHVSATLLLGQDYESITVP